MTRLKERPPGARPQHASQEGYGRAIAWALGPMGVFQELHANRGICQRGRENKVTHSWKEKRKKEQGARKKSRGAHHQGEKRAHKDARRVQHMLLHACGKMSHVGVGLWMDHKEPSKRLLMQREKQGSRGCSRTDSGSHACAV